MYCSNCGKELGNDENFCSNCGQPVNNEAEAHEQDSVSDFSYENLEDFISNTEEIKTNHPKRKWGIILAIIIFGVIIIILATAIFSSSNNDKKVKDKTIVKKEETAPSPNTDDDDTTTDAEYIIPHSDKEYLTDEDVENLSADKLALARNEIIARHGRIFADETYKTYFESKSWYKGTVEPAEFDANYENELSAIEKVNVELIKKYELKTNGTTGSSSTELAALAEKYYGDFLEYYKEQEAQGFTQKDMQLINPIFSDTAYFPNGYDKELYYTVIDLANDNVPELFISDMQTIYGAFCISENDYQICPLIETTNKFYLGDRIQCSICDNGIISEKRFKNELTSATTFYQLEPDATELTYVERVALNESKYIRTFSDQETSEEIDEGGYNKIINQYPLKENIEWCKLSEYKNNNSSPSNISPDYKTAYLELIKDESSSPLAMHYYFLTDIDQNEIPELIIAKSDTGDTIMCYVYSYDPETNAVQHMGSVPAPLANCYKAKNSQGVALLMRFAGIDNAVMLTLENDALIQEDNLENEEEEILYYHSQEALPRYEITDYSPLKVQ